MAKDNKSNPQRKKYWTEYFKTLEKNGNNEIKIGFDVFVRMLTVRRNGYGYHHLTNWRTLCKMMEPVVSPVDGKPHRMLHLGAAANMNDEDDSKCGKNVYFSSFSFGPMENVSMWNGYGIPTPEAVRVKFSSYSISKWETEFNAGKINVYGVNGANQLESLSCGAKLEMVQVAYWSKKEKGLNCSDVDEGLLFYDNDKFRISKKERVVERMKEKPYLFKEAGWSYENETRLVLLFDEDLADIYRRVAVDFDGPLEWLDQNFANDVTRGPWYDENSPLVQEKAGGHSLVEAKPSRYQGKINMRSMCDFCDEKDKTKCKCPFTKREKKKADCDSKINNMTTIQNHTRADSTEFGRKVRRKIDGWYQKEEYYTKAVERMVRQREEIIGLLESVKKVDTRKLLKYLDKSGFYYRPSAANRHHNFPGGLAEHSLGTYRIVEEWNNLSLEERQHSDLYVRFLQKRKVSCNILADKMDSDDMIIAAICHDLCKAEHYYFDGRRIKSHHSDPEPRKAHATLSVKRLRANGINTPNCDEMLLAVLMHMHLFSDPRYPKEAQNQQKARGSMLAIAVWGADKLDASRHPAGKLHHDR